MSGRGAILAAGVRGAAGALRGNGRTPAGTPASTVDPREPRYLGCRPADLARPYAAFMQSATRPAQRHAVEAYWSDPVPASAIPSFDDLADDLGGSGYSPIENGWGRGADGVVWVAVRTDMPRVTAAMWDWWFGWHSAESARYRLWHPDAHAYAALDRDLTATPGLSDRERYVGNTSYVDEYIGGQLEQLAIRFLDPAGAGLATSDTTTVVHARVGSSVAPVDLGWVTHQVRPVSGGCEMRSRFHLNLPGPAAWSADAARAAHRRGDLPALLRRLPFDVGYGRGLLEHCAREMNHLASFLPELYAQFGATGG